MQDSLFTKSVKVKNEDYYELDISTIDLDITHTNKPDLLSHFYHLPEPASKSISALENSETTQMRRYFADTLICYECGQPGHTNRKCPQRLAAVCIFCAKKGHQKHNCPMMVCNHCYMCGHRSSNCRNKDGRRFVLCRRCPSGEHTVRDCPASWREYKVTNNAKIGGGDDMQGKVRKACPICFSEDHFVDDCKKRNKTRFSIFNSNFMSIVKLYRK